MNVGLSPRHVISSLPTLRLPFDRVGTGIKRIDLSRLSFRRGASPEPTPGLGPIRLDRDLSAGGAPKWRVVIDRASAAASAGVDRAGAALRRISVDRGTDKTAAVDRADGESADPSSFARLSAAVSAGLGRLPLDRLPLDRLGPIARVDRRVLAVLGVLMLASFYGLFFANPASHQLEQVAAAEVAAKQAAAKPATPAVDPFDQGSINRGLRALRNTVRQGDHARSLLILGDGTLGTTIVRQGSWENVMVRGSDTVVEPLNGAPVDAAELNLSTVHGTAITRMLDQAATAYHLPKAKLASLRLTEHPGQPGTFIWTGTWNDAARTTLYADREAKSVSPTLPAK